MYVQMLDIYNENIGKNRKYRINLILSIFFYIFKNITIFSNPATGYVDFVLLFLSTNF